MIAPVPEELLDGSDAYLDMSMRPTRRKIVRGRCACLYCDAVVTTTDGVVDEHHRGVDFDEIGLQLVRCIGVGGIQSSFERLTGRVIVEDEPEVVRFSKALPGGMTRHGEPRKPRAGRKAGHKDSNRKAEEQEAAVRAVMGDAV